MATEPSEPEPDTLRAFINYQGTYHNHKEQLGYLAAALYVSGALVLFFGPNRWSSYPAWAKALFVGLLAVTGLAGMFYVFWQFYLRSITASRIDWFLDRLDRRSNWPPESWSERHCPWLLRWGAPGAALLVMLLWGAAAFVRVVCSLG